MKNPSFYCSVYCDGAPPHEEFSIDRWNKEFELNQRLRIDKMSTDYECNQQCEGCLNIYLDRKLSSNLVKKLDNLTPKDNE